MDLVIAMVINADYKNCAHAAYPPHTATAHLRCALHALRTGAAFTLFHRYALLPAAPRLAPTRLPHAPDGARHRGCRCNMRPALHYPNLFQRVQVGRFTAALPYHRFHTRRSTPFTGAGGAHLPAHTRTRDVVVSWLRYRWTPLAWV